MVGFPLFAKRAVPEGKIQIYTRVGVRVSCHWSNEVCLGTKDLIPIRTNDSYGDRQGKAMICMESLLYGLYGELGNQSRSRGMNAALVLYWNTRFVLRTAHAAGGSD
jgi:hypothetical protein